MNGDILRRLVQRGLFVPSSDFSVEKLPDGRTVIRATQAAADQVAQAAGGGAGVKVGGQPGGGVRPGGDGPGACCQPGTCSILTQTDCDAAGGIYLGQGTLCDPNPCPSVCCFSDGSCSDRGYTHDACIAAGGVPDTITGRTCATVGPCCRASTLVTHIVGTTCVQSDPDSPGTTTPVDTMQSFTSPFGPSFGGCCLAGLTGVEDNFDGTYNLDYTICGQSYHQSNLDCNSGFSDSQSFLSCPDCIPAGSTFNTCPSDGCAPDSCADYCNETFSIAITIT
jgi:hypothetical protein